MIWMPHVTVATVVEKNGRFLLVEEVVDGQRCFNQPAGHWDPGETLLDAVVRETLEETGYLFQPEYLTGIYHWEYSAKSLTYLRFAFGGRLGPRDPSRALDAGIIGPAWLTSEEMAARGGEMRSVMVQRCMADYQAGNRYPLDLLHTI